MAKLWGRDLTVPPLPLLRCLPLLSDEPAGHEATTHQESASAKREQRCSAATAGLRQLLLLLGLFLGLLLSLPGRRWSRRRLGCRRRSGLRRGSRSGSLKSGKGKQQRLACLRPYRGRLRSGCGKSQSIICCAQLCSAITVDARLAPPKSPPLRPVAVALLAQRLKASVQFLVVAHLQG